MTVTIDLAHEEATTLRRKAASLGKPTEVVAAALLKQILHTDAASRDNPAGPMAEAEFHAYWGPYVGVIQGSHEALSEDGGEKFTDYLKFRHFLGCSSNQNKLILCL